MIAFHDNDRVLSAFWLPEKAPLVFVLPPKRTIYSDAAVKIVASGKQPILVEGNSEGAESDNPEIFAKCVKGELEINGEQCAQAYKNLRYTVDVEKIKAVVKNFK
jgi:hypothetical protein